MINQEKKRLIVSLVIAIISIVLIIVIVVIKISNTRASKKTDANLGISNSKNNSVIENTQLQSNVKNSNNTVASVEGEEKTRVEEYINSILNHKGNPKIVEFNNINNADKLWLYSHIKSIDDISYDLSTAQVEQQLRALFGNNLIIDVEYDNSSDNAFLKYNEQLGKYSIPIYSIPDPICYTINTIKREDEKYIVNVVEYRYYENYGDTLVVNLYDDSDNDWKEVFKMEILDDISEVDNEVLKRKDKFPSYNVTLEKKYNGLLNVVGIEKCR